MKNLLVLLFVLFAIANFVQAQNLVINEFLASNDSCCTDEFGEYDDWIEIYNPGNAPVDIGGMYITDDLTAPTTWQIPTTAPDSTTIPAGGFLVLWADKQSEQGILHVEIKLSGGGEQIGLYESNGTTVLDSLTYSAQTTDISEGLLPDGSNNWLNFDNPTPGYTNRTIPLIVNEFMASNDTYIQDPFGEFDDWIEIFNAGASPVDIGGMYITDDLAAPTTWQIPTTAPDTTTIQPGEFLVLWADKQSEQGILHIEIKLSGSGEQIGLFESDGTTPIDTLTFGPQLADTSYGRAVDGGNTWAFFSTPSIGATNASGVIIVGINDAQGDIVSNSFTLSQNYPNPFNPTTQIHFQLPERSNVNITVYNLIGERIKTLVNETLPKGLYTTGWDATNEIGLKVSSGFYIYTLKINNSIVGIRKMVYIR